MKIYENEKQKISRLWTQCDKVTQKHSGNVQNWRKNVSLKIFKSCEKPFLGFRFDMPSTYFWLSKLTD